MNAAAFDPGSFRDPGGRIFTAGGRILRAVYSGSAADYEAVRDSGLLKELGEAGLVVSTRELADAPQLPGDPVHVLEHERLPFISYPYEWSFTLHKKAALLQLDLMLRALERGFTLSDATAYNIQLVGTRPIYIDHLSFQPYEEGAIWAGHRQFCMQFLNPLLMWTRLGVSPNAWFRGTLEGIAPEDLAPLLRRRDRLSWTILSHVIVQASAQRRANEMTPKGRSAAHARLPRRSFVAMLDGLRSFVAKTELPRQATVWDRYDTDNSYSGGEAANKAEFVKEMVAAVRPAKLFDLGCNTGDYSLAALEAGAGYVVGFDFDFGALERAVARSDRENLPFLPLWLDATNPSPAQGWGQQERKGFSDRADADAVIALAFIHHLAIARNIPLGMAVDWIMSVAPVGVIEFPPKTDPMVQQLLANREDIFPDYSEERFLAEVRARGRVIRTKHLSKDGRLLVWFDRGEKGATRRRAGTTAG